MQSADIVWQFDVTIDCKRLDLSEKPEEEANVWAFYMLSLVIAVMLAILFPVLIHRAAATSLHHQLFRQSSAKGAVRRLSYFNIPIRSAHRHETNMRVNQLNVQSQGARRVFVTVVASAVPCEPENVATATTSCAIRRPAPAAGCPALRHSGADP